MPRILVVEDESIVALDIQSRLKKLGYTMAGTASSGEDAMLAVGENPPDVILMDVHLGSGIDGVEAAARIRENFRIPVVFITAYADQELISRIRLTEPFAYILKPFEEPELHAAIEIALLRHKLEQTLYEQKQLLATTLNSIGDGVIVTGDDGHIRFMNPVAETMTGWSQDEAVGKDLTTVYRVRDPDLLMARDDTTRRIAFKSNLMVDSQGNWTGFVHAFTDITDREAAREALYHRELEFRMLMEQADEAIVITDRLGAILTVNSRMCELAGYTREELLFMNIATLLNADPSGDRLFCTGCIQKGQSVWGEHRLARRDARTVHVEVCARGLSDGRIQGVLHDITDRKRTEEEFQKNVRSKAVEKLRQEIAVLEHGESGSVILNRLGMFVENLETLQIRGGAPAGDAALPLQRFRLTAEEFEQVVAARLLFISSLFTMLESDPSCVETFSPLAGAGTQLCNATVVIRSVLPEILALLGGGTETERLGDLARQASDAVAVIRRVIAECNTTLQRL